MDILQKVLWAEGIFLSQQHFQAWEQYLEDQQTIRQKNIAYHNWGLIKLETENSATLGTVYTLKKVVAIFPDGRLVYCKTPIVCNLDQVEGNDLSIYLQFPKNNQAHGISGYSTEGQTKAWEAVYEEIADIHDEARKREVMLGAPLLKLIASGEAINSENLIKIAELTRKSKTEFALNELYIPPVMQISASSLLADQVKSVMSSISAKVGLAVDAAVQAENLGEYNYHDVIRLIRNQSLNKALVALKQIGAGNSYHPEQFYQVLCQLLAELSPIEKPKAVLNVPNYQHEAIAYCITTLSDMLNELLHSQVRKANASAKLEIDKNGYRTAKDLSEEKLEAENYYLGVYLEKPDTNWIAEFPMQIKLGSADELKKIIISSLQGVTTTHTQRPPNSLSVKSGYEYFRIEKTGRHWDRIVETKTLSIHLPSGYEGANIELVSVEE